MKKLFGIAALLAASSVQAQPVDIGTGDWTKLPEAMRTGEVHFDSAFADAVEELAQKGTCRLPGLTAGRVDISVPFTLKFQGPRQVEHIVLRDLGCPELETILGLVVRQFAADGRYLATGGPGWYRSAFGLTIE